MDIRTKLVFALVAVALGSMFALGAVMYATVEGDLREVRLEELEALADAKELGLEQVAAGWRDRVSLIAGRTQVRMSLQEYSETGRPEARERIRRILNEAMRAVDVVESVAVYDREGRLVAHVDSEEGAQPPLEETPWIAQLTNVSYQGVSTTAAGRLRVDYGAPLLLEGLEIGLVHVQLDAAALISLTADYDTSLEEGTEAMIVFRDADGSVRVLRPDGSGDADPLDPVEPRGPGDPVALALDRREGTYWEGITSQDGKPVWVAIRHIPETNWGLVIQLDEEEGRAPVVAFRTNLTDLAMALGAFAMVLGTILGLRFAAPIHELAVVADRIRSGNLSARAVEKGEDEVGFLARAFNQMAEEMEDRVTLLAEFQRFFEVSLDMLCIAGPDGYFKRVNPAFNRILGWTRDELLAKPFVEFVHPEDREETMGVLADLAQGIPTVAFENRYQCADGSWRIISWRAQPDPDSGLIYAMARDVTQRREDEEEAREQIKELRDRLYEADAKLRGGD